MPRTWTRVRHDLAEDPAVIHMADTLGIDPDEVVGKCHRVWSWFDRQTIDGNARCVTKTWLARYVGSAEFVTAFAAVGWLIVTDEGLQIPEWDRYNSETSKARALAAERKAKHSRKGNAKGNAARVTKASPRIEKSREEKKKQETLQQQPSVIALDIDAIANEFNACGGVAPFTQLSPSRRRKLVAKLREPGWLELYRRALAKFPLGYKGENGDWKDQSFDWLLEGDHVLQIVEGSYDNPHRKRGQDGTGKTGATPDTNRYE